MNKLVIFDLDGTIIDSVPDITDNINLMLKKFGYPEVSDKDIMRFIGRGARNLVKDSIGISLPDEKIDECLQYYNQIYTASGSPKTKVFDGVGEVLIDLKRRGYLLAIITNKPQSTTDNVYENYLSKYEFDAVIGQSEKFPKKPDKASTVALFKKFSVKKEDVYFVGDGETDYQTSANAGVNGISVLWGYRSREQLQKVGATCFAETPKDLLSIIK